MTWKIGDRVQFTPPGWPVPNTGAITALDEEQQKVSIQTDSGPIVVGVPYELLEREGGQGDG